MTGKFSITSAGIIALMITVLMAWYPEDVYACTAFVYRTGDRVLLAKNLDWPIGEGLIIANKKGVWKKAYGGQENKLSWVSKYGSVTFNQFGKEFPLGGMNESGLVIEELNLFGDPQVNGAVFQLNEFQWVQYCLDNFSNVEELKTGMEGIIVKPAFQMLHYMICDENGNTAVVEFFRGEMYVYDGSELPYPVLSNDLYENLLKYSQNFQGFGGDMPIRKETTTGERFLRVAELLNEDDEWKTSDPVEAAFSILDTVRQEDTRWSIIYDAVDRIIYYRTHLSRMVKRIDLEGFDFSCNSSLLCMDILNDCEGNVDDLFIEYSDQDNIDHLERVHHKYELTSPTGDSGKKFTEMASYGNSVRCYSDWKYFGQQPPGREPKVFAPGIISGNGRIHCFPAISPDIKEIYWMTLPPRIYVSEYRDDGWTEPQISPVFHDIPCLRPGFSPDGKRVYFATNLPGGYGSLDIWYMERNDTGFLKPVNIGPMVNTDKFEAQQTFTDDGTIYYTGHVPGKKWDRGILCSIPDGDDYLRPEVLDRKINIMDTNAIDYTPFISRDGSFLLFSSNRHDLSSEGCRVYISFRKDGSWMEPVNLSHEIGFDRDSRDPYISPDGKYLFFSSGENIYWMDSGIIEKLSPLH